MSSYGYLESPSSIVMTTDWRRLADADARLIAAAPDLLEACKSAVDALDGLAPDEWTIHDELKAALAKAEGKKYLEVIVKTADYSLKEPLIARTGVGLIAAERQRQMTVEGWTPEHDDSHEGAELLQAAIWYLDDGADYNFALNLPPWPWEQSWWKPSTDAVRQLVKAGALIAAEIDRLQRRELVSKSKPHHEGCHFGRDAECDCDIAKAEGK